jgi:hypothetical protein
MEKKTIARFLNEKRRGAYTLLVEMYTRVVTEMPITLALTEIKEDLEKASGTNVELHYFSLARAISRFKKNAHTKPGALTTRKREFKDAHELEEGQLSPGKFKYIETKVKDVQ